LSTQVTHESVELTAFIRFLRAHAAITRQLDRELVQQHGLTINDYEVLLNLTRAPERSLRRVDLAERVLLTPSGITRLLDGLERAGLVSRASCKTDARVVYARITEKGLRRLEAASESHRRSIRTLFAQRFDDGELQAFADLLDRLPQTAGPDCAEGRSDDAGAS
jgi:DNA-binding MarR family transcriptional regulator